MKSKPKIRSLEPSDLLSLASSRSHLVREAILTIAKMGSTPGALPDPFCLGIRVGVQLASGIQISEEQLLEAVEKLELRATCKSLEDAILRKSKRGRPPMSDRWTLITDALLLQFEPEAFSNLLRDALDLRSQQYKVQGNYARAHAEAWDRFWKAKRATEVRCRRLYKQLKRNPETPPPDWWEPIARKHKLMG